MSKTNRRQAKNWNTEPGGLAAAYIFYFYLGMEIWDHSPRSGAYIDALARAARLI